MNPVVSIIVPVYNAEKDLARCIDSVLKQDYDPFELILVNDGSSDQSGAICDAYAQKDARIRIIHKNNTGVSDSRNMAMDIARGTYLQFLDSDDWITPDATKLLVCTAMEHQCDMVIADFYRVVGERVSHKGDIQENGILSREEFATYMMEKPADFYYGVLWNKLYRRDIIEKHNIRMDAEISWCEDFMFNMEYIRQIRTVYALHVPIYYYVKTKGSLVSQGMSISKTIKMKRSVFEYYNQFYQDVFGEEDYEKSRIQVYRFLIDAASDGIVLPAILPGSIKLGKERIRISIDAMENEGLLADAYRERKLLDRYLETAALKNDLTLEEIRLLLYISQAHKSGSLREIAESTNLSRGMLNIVLQKLASKGLIKTRDAAGKAKDPSGRPTIGKETASKKESTASKKKEPPANPIDWKIAPEAEPILADLLMAQTSFEQMKFAGFREEELEQYELLQAKVRQNIKNALK